MRQKIGKMSCLGRNIIKDAPVSVSVTGELSLIDGVGEPGVEEGTEESVFAVLSPVVINVPSAAATVEGMTGREGEVVRVVVLVVPMPPCPLVDVVWCAIPVCM